MKTEKICKMSYLKENNKKYIVVRQCYLKLEGGMYFVRRNKPTTTPCEKASVI